MSTPALRVSAGLLTRLRQVLICQRRPADPHPLKWEFPGGKAEADEDAAECLRRELREELDIEARVGAVLSTTTHTYPNGRTVTLSFLHVPTYERTIINKQFHALAWVAPEQVASFDFLEGDVAFVRALAEGRWAQLFSDPQAAICHPQSS